MLSDQDDVDAMRTKSQQVFRRSDARLADQDPRVFNQIGHSQRMIDVSFHRAQIAIVDAEQGITRMRKSDMVEDSAEIFCVVDFQ